MKASELISLMKSNGYDKAASILEKRTENNPTSLFISDMDDEAYESELAQWLQDHTTWFNCLNKNGFKAIFK